METWVEGEISWTCCWQPPAQAEVQSLNDRGVEGHYRGHTLANNGRGEHDRSPGSTIKAASGLPVCPGGLPGERKKDSQAMRSARRVLEERRRLCRKLRA